MYLRIVLDRLYVSVVTSHVVTQVQNRVPRISGQEFGFTAAIQIKGTCSLWMNQYNGVMLLRSCNFFLSKCTIYSSLNHFLFFINNKRNFELIGDRTAVLIFDSEFRQRKNKKKKKMTNCRQFKVSFVVYN